MKDIKNNIEEIILNDTEKIKNYNINENNEYKDTKVNNISSDLKKIKINKIIDDNINNNIYENNNLNSDEKENNINNCDNNNILFSISKKNCRILSLYSKNNLIHNNSSFNFRKDRLYNIHNKNNYGISNVIINDDIYNENYSINNKYKMNDSFINKRKKHSKSKRYKHIKTKNNKYGKISKEYLKTTKPLIEDENSKESFEKKIIIEEEKFPKNKTKNFNLFHSILITFIYIIFGHFFIPINIYLIESYIKESFLILASIILIIIPFFFIQIIFNLILLIIYVKKIGYKLFLTEFYYNIKMKVSIYRINLITYKAYHILAVLFLGTFWKILKTLAKFYGKKLFIFILGIILSLIILPLHIIINPLLLFYAVKKIKYKKNKENGEIKLLKAYIYDI